jgi:hypothetical protein
MSTNPTAEGPATRQRGRAMIELRRRELRRERLTYGKRIQWEAVFFGLLAAIGLAASLVAMVLGGLVAAGVTSFRDDASSLVDHMMTAGGAIPVAILALSYLTGGYVAARMARFDGWRQGVGIWLLSLLMAVAVAITAWIAGGDADPTKSISLPSNPIDEGPLQSGWAILAVALAVPLVFAIVGAVLGERFHRAVDRAGFEAAEAAADDESLFAADGEPEAETEVEPEADEPEAETAVESEPDLDPATEEGDQPYGPRREREDAPASAASSSADSTSSPAASP